MRVSRSGFLMALFITTFAFLFGAYKFIEADFNPRPRASAISTNYVPDSTVNESSYSVEIVTNNGSSGVGDVAVKNGGYEDFGAIDGGNAVVRGNTQYEIASKLESDENVISYRFINDEPKTEDKDYFVEIENAGFKKDKSDKNMLYN
jgi:hypothetical protein